MVTIFGGALVGVTAYVALQERSEVIREAKSELEMIARAVASDVDATSAARRNTEFQVFERELPGRVVAHAREIHVSDKDGRIVGSAPVQTQWRTLVDLLGPLQLITTYAEAAGVVELTLSDGRPALVTVRNLKEPLGQVAIIQPIEAVLQPWRLQTWRVGVMLGIALALLCGVAGAYQWQMARADEANDECDRIGHRMESALTHGRCGLWEWDLARGRLYFSHSMYQMLGMEMRGDALSIGDVNALMHPADGDLNVMASLLLAKEMDVIDHVFRIRNAAGEWMWIHARAELDTKRKPKGAYLIGIALDITQQRQLEEQTRTADARLAAAIDTISEAFVLWDCDNRLVICNAKFLNFLSLPEDFDCTGMHYDRVMDHAVLPQVKQEVAINERREAGARRYEAQLADGRWLQVNERRTSDGGYVSVGTDITALKQHEEKLMESERRLMGTVADLRRSRQTLEVQARQLAELAERYLEQKAEAEMASRAKSAFLGNMSHELRTPLNAIIGFSQVMEDQTFGPLGSTRYLDYTTHIRESGQHLLGIIGDVLEMSRLETGAVDFARAEVDVGDIVAAAADQIEDDVLAKSLVLTLAPHPHIKICADRDAIEKALVKLLRNAAKFTPDGGSINVTVSALDGCARIIVEDSGEGIRPEDLERLGKPFEQINSPLQNGLKGSGLGLAIARSLTELHGGALRITSSVGVGTKVEITLPARSFVRDGADQVEAA